MRRPKFISFDCQGTLIHNPYVEWSKKLYADRLSPDALDAFTRHFKSYRFDETMGPWKPFRDVIANALERTCRRIGIDYDPAFAQQIYDDIPNWKPHADAPAGLARLAREFPLVGLTNSMNSQIMSNMDQFGVKFHAIITAEQVQSYKPRMKGFDDMFDQLGVGPEDMLHVSSSFRYDLLTATDAGITNKCWVNRNHEPVIPYVEHYEVADIGGVADLLGLPAAVAA